MRYPEGQGPDRTAPYGESMHDMLNLSMSLSVLIGIVLLIAARRGRVLWLTVWSLALIGCSIAYLGGELIGVI